jgi:hypothetical protein
LIFIYFIIASQSEEVQSLKSQASSLGTDVAAVNQRSRELADQYDKVCLHPNTSRLSLGV